MVLQHLLLQFYERVETLPDYLESVLPDSAKQYVRQIFVTNEPTTSSFAVALQRLESSLVCTSSASPFDEQQWVNWKPPGSQEAKKEGSLSELVHFAQGRLLKSGAGSRHASNMLTLGYREADDRLGALREVRMAGSYAITNLYVNPFVSMIVMGKEWQHMFDRLGSVVLLHLFTRTSIFLPVSEGEDNMTQIIGPSLSEVHPLSKEELRNTQALEKLAGRKRKRGPCRGEGDVSKGEELTRSQPMLAVPRTKTLASRSKSDSAVGLLQKAEPFRKKVPRMFPIFKKASDIHLPRSKIFYARPMKTRSGHVALGLPIMHIFNRTLNKSSSRNTVKMEKTISSKDLHPTKQSKCDRAERSRKVIKYIWPRQYRLCNVFASKESKLEGMGIAHDYTNREEAIKAKGPMRMPKRLHTASRLVSIMLAKHDRLNYSKLLQYCCPSALRSKRLTRTEKEQILLNLTDISKEEGTFSASQVQTQPAATQAGGSYVASQYLVQSQAVPPQKPAFTKYKVATGSVSRFTQAVLRHILPFELLGSNHNLRVLLKNVDTFVRLRRHETLNLHHLCQGLRILDCHWLLPRNKRALIQRPTAAEMQKRHNLLHELIYYIFDSIVIPLLRTNFYATESVAFRNRTVYFRQDDWNSITLPILEKLKAGCFTTLNKNEAISIMNGRDFGYSYVRLLPKLNGVRPIVNLRRRSVKIDRNKSDAQQVVQQQHSINNILNVTFHVLNYEKKSDLGRLGSSVFGAQDVYERLFNFKEKLLASNNGSLPRLYFVKVDVACAFDSIDQEKLLEIVQDIVSHDRYVIQKFCQIMAKGDRVSKSWPRVACAEEEAESTLRAVEDHAKDLNNVVLCDGVVYTHCERSKLIWLLEEHINNNLIKVGKVFCKQRVGIPQGSTLSTLLCCYYLAKMEAANGFGNSNDNDGTLLMRYTDDFLYISTSQETTRRFYEVMKAGDDTFNVKIAVEKSLHNLDMGLADENTRLPNDHMLFPWCSYLINTKDLSVQYDMTRYYHANLADTLTINHKKPIQNLSRVLQSSIRNQNMTIFLDVHFNGIKVVIGNLYRNFLLAALKFISCYREIRRVYGMKRNDAYLISCINASIGLCYAGIQAKMKRSLRNRLASWEVDRSTFHLIALHAFARIFSLRPRCHKWAAHLHQQMRSSHHYQVAYRTHLQHMNEAWQSCKGIIASIKV